MIYRFGPYTLDPAAYRLLRESEVVQLSPKIIDLLLYLVARQPALVSKEDLFKALWPDVAVTDNALTQAVSELRQALGDDPSKPAYIQTVARRGYRFIAPVSTAAPSPDEASHAVSQGVAPYEHAPAQLSIAVMDFSNVSGDRELAWLSSGIAETVTNDLRATSPMRVVDRVRVVEASRRVGTDLSTLRAELHLDLAVVGSFQRAGNRLRITARVVDAAGGEATAEAKADGPLDHVFELQDRIVTQFAHPQRIGRSPKGGCGWSRSRPRSCPTRSPTSSARSPSIRDTRRRMSASRTRGSGSTRCHARATSRTRCCWRGRSITCGRRSSWSGISPRRTRRCRSF